MTASMTTAERIIQSVCELQEMPPLDHPETVVINVDDLRTIIENHLRTDLYDADEFMADGEVPMTAAENVLAWLLIKKIGVVDDVGYTPNQAKEIIVASIDDAGKQLVESGGMLLHAETVITDLTSLLQATKEVIDCASDTYRKRNGHRGSFEDDSGEKCWIVPFDAFEGMRSAVEALAPTSDSTN